MTEPPRIVHIETRVQAVFGALDADDNATVAQPVNLVIHKFTKEAFIAAYETLKAQRDKSVESLGG